MVGRRVFAAAALVCLVAAVVAAVIEIVRDLPRGLLTIALLAAGVLVAWQALLRRGSARGVLAAGVGLLLVAAVVVVLSGDRFGFGLAAIGLLILGVAIARPVFRVDATLKAAAPPRRAVVVWNPRSGGGKAVSNNLPEEARARGIEPIELEPGDDLTQLVRDAVARGADGLAAAGGDGTQALVASIAAEHDLPFACIPAGTRNHFALDLGVDRDDVVGALDAFVTGGERRVDLAEINGRVFVNNVSFGLYAEAVQREGYRDAKLRTILDTAPDVLDAQPDERTAELGWRGPDGRAHESAAVILVSNNAYRLGRVVGSGTRSRMDAGELGLAVLQTPQAHRAGSPLAAMVGSGLRGDGVGAGAGWRRRRGAPPGPAASARQPAAGAAGAHRAATPGCLTVGRAPRGGSRHAPTAVRRSRRTGMKDGGSRASREGGGPRSSSPARAGPSVGGAHSSRWCFCSRS